MTPCSDLNFLQKPTKIKKNRGKGILRNGNGLSAVPIEKIKIYFRQTCAFDSISEILSNAYCEFQSFNSFVTANLPNMSNSDQKNKKDKIDQRLCYMTFLHNYSINGPDNTLYIHRGHVLRSLYPQQSTEELSIDCRVNVNQLFHRIMNEYQNIKIIKTCLNCKKDNNNPMESSEITTNLPNVHTVWDNNYNDLEDSLNEKFQTHYVCKKCGNMRDTNYILGSYLLLEVETAYQHSTYAESIGKDTSTVRSKVEDIPENLVINGMSFVLCGVIRFIPPHTTGGLGHYTAYCRKNNGKWDYKDDQHGQKKVNCSVKDYVKISSILYVRT